MDISSWSEKPADKSGWDDDVPAKQSNDISANTDNTGYDPE